MRGAEYICKMRDASILDVATQLDVPIRKTTIATCPACGVSRPERGGKLTPNGASGVGTREDRGWSCFACHATGDQLDYISLTLCGRRLRDCSASQVAEVRQWCHRYLGLAGEREPRSTARGVPSEAEPRYADPQQLRAMWRTTAPVTAVPEVSRYLESRGIDPVVVAARQLARAITPSTALCTGARLGRRTWLDTGHLLVLPLVDARGRCRSLLGRSVSTASNENAPPKSLGLSGSKRAGLVLCDAVGRYLLEHDPVTSCVGEIVCILEGEIDYLTASCDARTDEFAHFGVGAGAWTEQHAERIPLHAHLWIATDQDPTGDRYAAEIINTLPGRSDLIVRRWSAPSNVEAAQ
jgi:hypothetical protein